MLFLSAFAQEAASTVAALPPQPSALAGIMPILLILVVFYFLLIRPQQKRYKEHLSLVSGVAKGDTVITSGGIVGKVTKVDADKDMLHVEIADGVEVKVIRSTLSGVLDANGKPVDAASKTQSAAKPAKSTATAAKTKKPAAKKDSKAA